MSYEKNCPFCNPTKDHHQKIIVENKNCYFLQHDKQQDVL